MVGHMNLEVQVDADFSRARRIGRCFGGLGLACKEATLLTNRCASMT